MSETRSKILSTAEDMVRSGGYNGFSFREIASSIGIKSASVHHHFPTKEELTLEVVKQYRNKFFSALGEPRPKGKGASEQLSHYCHIFKKAFESSGYACLCGVLSNESEKLPSSLREEVVKFVEENVSWLEEVLGIAYNTNESGVIRIRAQTIYSTLEGAIGVASLKQDGSWLDRVAKEICYMALKQSLEG